MIFVDTGVWYTAYSPRDRDCDLCRALLEEHRDRLVTTDYVVAELFNLMNARGLRHRAVELSQPFWEGKYAQLNRVTDNDLAAAADVFTRFTDKRWSFTDCTSYAVMQRLGINEALALDATSGSSASSK